MELHHLRKIHKRLLRDNPGNILIGKPYGGKCIMAAIIKDHEAVKVFFIETSEEYDAAKAKEKQIIELAKKHSS